MNQQNAKILIVEDDKDLCTAMQRRLGKEYELSVFHDARSALVALQKGMFKVAILDIKLPDIGGLELLEILKVQDHEIVPIVTTTEASLESAVEAMRHGAYTYLIKPIDMERLSLAVENGLEKWRMNREIVQMQKELITSEKMAAIGKLAAGVAHEVNNPLMIISGRAELLLGSGAIKDEKTKQIVRLIYDQAQAAAKITTGLLRFAKMDGAKFMPHDINEIIEKTVNLVEHQFKLKNIAIVKKPAPLLPAVPADAGELQAVLINLMNNAEQAMTQGGTITLATQPEGGAVRIDVADTGCGIPKENISKIFDPFFSTKERGTGLGLAVVAGIIENHGGTISVASEPGKGTTFTMRLPIKYQGAR